LPSAGVALDQRQRVQHLVVDHGGHLGAFLLADPAFPLGPQLAERAPEQRRHHDADAEQPTCAKITPLRTEARFPAGAYTATTPMMPVATRTHRR
jgi:hypothetical protein